MRRLLAVLAVASMFGVTCASATNSTQALNPDDTLHVTCPTSLAVANQTATALDVTCASYVVPSSIPSDCSTAADVAINQWLATVPDGATAQLKAGGCYGINESIILPGRNNLTLDGNGATIKALTCDGNNNQNRADLIASRGSNITFENITLRGANDGRFGPVDGHCNGLDQEWQHGVDFNGTSGGTFKNSAVYDTYGDFVEAQPPPDPQYSSADAARNILVDTVTMVHAGRMGLGLTNTIGFIAQNSSMTTIYNAGVDIEPDVTGEVVQNVTIRNDTFDKVNFSLLSVGGAITPGNIGPVTFDHNTMKKVVACQPPIWVGIGGGTVNGFTVTNNTLDTLDAEQIVANGATISGNTITGYIGGCGQPSGFYVVNSKNVSITGNQLIGINCTVFADVVNNDPNSTNVTQSGNTMTKTGC